MDPILVASSGSRGGFVRIHTGDKEELIDEIHYSPKELANKWGLSSRFVRDLFRDELGVLLIERPEERFKRAYSTIRIPASVAKRVYERHQTSAKRKMFP